MDHVTGTMFLYNLVVQCNKKNAVCNARVALRDMGALRVQNTTQWNGLRLTCVQTIHCMRVKPVHFPLLRVFVRFTSFIVPL